MPRKEVKTILFDLDGVLIDSLNAWRAAFNAMRRKDGAPSIPKSEFKKNFGMPAGDDIMLYFPGKTVKQLNALKDEFFLKSCHLVKIFPQAIPVLQGIKSKGFKTGLISNSTRRIVRSTLRSFSLGQYFDCVITVEDVECGKPAPDMVLKACKMLKVKPRNAVLVGDTQNDMVAGRRAGCITVGLKTKGEHTIRALASLPPLIKRFK